MIDALKKARSILLDSNLLVLYLVGSLETALIGNHKRTRGYTVEDFGLLRAIISSKRSLISTPNVMTEVSNLLGQIGEPRRRNMLTLLGQLCQQVDERYLDSGSIGRSHCFVRLGLTDAGLVDLCQRGLLLLTDDLQLFLEVERLGGSAINFNHIRTVAWE